MFCKQIELFLNLIIIVLLTSSCTKEELEKKKYTKVSFDALYKAFSSADKDVNFRYKLNDQMTFFTVYKIEPDDYQISYIGLPALKKTQLKDDSTDAIARQMEDVVMLCDKFNNQKQLLDISEVEIDRLNSQSYSLANNKDTYDKKVIVKCLALLNEKKKFIRDGMMNNTRANDSSFDIHDFILNEGLQTSPKKEPEEYPKVGSPVASTSAFASKSVTPKSSAAATQKSKRTPSKKLFAQISQPSDSNESDDYLLTMTSSKSKKRKSPDNPDTSSIFKDFKAKTPKKLRREEKESSVEAKMECSDSHRPRDISSPSEIESRSSIENAQRIGAEGDKKYSDPLDVFKSQGFSQEIFSQAVEDNLNSSSEVLPNQKKNPYSLDTVNILDM